MDHGDPLPLAVLLQLQAQNYLDMAEEEAHMAEILERMRTRKRRKDRTWWVSPSLTPDLRRETSFYHRQLTILRTRMPQKFKDEMRMPVELYDEILDKIRLDITGPGTNYRESLDAGFKLSTVLKYLAHGKEYRSLWADMVVSPASICNMIEPVCLAIQRHYLDEVFKTPTTREEWLAVAKDFEERWNLPHALGALDGKHCRIKRPNKSGSLYWSVYKKCYSVVLMALVDAKYKFLWIDVGGLGHQSDAQIYNHSDLKELLESGDLDIPPPAVLPNDPPKPAPYVMPPDPVEGEEPEEPEEPAMIHPKAIPYFIIGDDAFALSKNLQKPMAKHNQTRRERIYSYRMSRARRVVENAFGILVHRWRVMYYEMQVHPKKAQMIIKTCIILHNLLRIRYPRETARAADIEQADGNYIPGHWRATVGQQVEEEAPGLGKKQATMKGKDLQKYLTEYFNDPNRGAVPFQDEMIDNPRRAADQ